MESLSSPVFSRPIPENLRFYFPDGQPCFEVDSADGRKKVSPTIAHVRKLGLVRSVTTILRETLASPTLTRWREENAATAMLAVLREAPERTDAEAMQAWVERLEERSAAVIDPGKAIHAAIEMHFRGEEVPAVYELWVRTAVDALRDWFPMANWEPEKLINTRRGYGGRCDLYGDGAVVDVKTRSGDLKKVKPYESEPMQLAAYSAALDNGITANLYLSRDDPTACVLLPYSAEQQREALDNFDSLHAVFRSVRGLGRLA